MSEPIPMSIAWLQETDLAFEVGLGLDLPLLFETIHNILISPANLVRQALRNRQIDESRVAGGYLTFTVQYFLPGFNLSTRRASGTTILFFLSYGGGTPSYNLRRSKAAAPRAVLWGTMPRMAR